jgi:serine/threonine-protein kinase
MAPEAIDGGRLDQRYDLFAAGILLFESLCRRHLFGGRSDVEILNQVRACRVPPIERYHPNVPVELKQVVHRALSRDPHGRYADAAEFARALRQAMHPIAESEAATELRAFVTDLYARPDFPINRPKLPDLDAQPPSETTRSIVLKSNLARADASHLTEADAAAASGAAVPPRTGTPAIIALSLAVMAIGVVVAYLVYATVWTKELSRPPDERPIPIVVNTITKPVSPPPVGGGSRDATAEVSGAAPSIGAKDAPTASKPSRRKPVRRVVRFTPEVGQKAFRRRLGQIQRCYARHSPSGNATGAPVLVSDIRRDGRVSFVHIEPVSLAKTKLGRCLLAVARRVRYPRHDRARVTFRQPLAPTRAGSPK